MKNEGYCWVDPEGSSSRFQCPYFKTEWCSIVLTESLVSELLRGCLGKEEITGLKTFVIGQKLDRTENDKTPFLTWVCLSLPSKVSPLYQHSVQT